MAELKFKFRIGRCEQYDKEYTSQCHTQFAKECACGCRHYYNGGIRREDGTIFIPYGDCHYAHYDYFFKGMVCKNYFCEIIEDSLEPVNNCALLTIRDQKYECEELYIDGVKVYPLEVE